MRTIRMLRLEKLVACLHPSGWEGAENGLWAVEVAGAGPALPPCLTYSAAGGTWWPNIVS